MKIKNEKQLQELIKQELINIINENVDDPQKENLRKEIDRQWQWLEGSLYGHKGGAPGMLSAWRQGIINDESTTIGAIENATQIAHRVSNVLHSNKDMDPNIAKAHEYITKLMSKMVTVRLQLLQAFSQLRGQPDRLEQKIGDIQSVNEGFLSQLFGYAYTALEGNGLLTRSALEEDALEEGKCPPGHYWKSFGGQGGTCIKDPDYKGPKSAYSQGGTVSPPRGSHTPKYEE